METNTKCPICHANSFSEINNHIICNMCGCTIPIRKIPERILEDDRLTIEDNVVVSYRGNSRVVEIPVGVTEIRKISVAGELIIPKTVITLGTISAEKISIPESVLSIKALDAKYVKIPDSFSGTPFFIDSSYELEELIAPKYIVDYLIEKAKQYYDVKDGSLGYLCPTGASESPFIKNHPDLKKYLKQKEDIRNKRIAEMKYRRIKGLCYKCGGKVNIFTHKCKKCGEYS